MVAPKRSGLVGKGLVLRPRTELRAAAFAVGLSFGAALPATAAAAVRRVPQDFASIQQAIDASEAEDEIDVASGTYCGAVIDKPLALVGHEGATIVGCPDGPSLASGLRIGFFLPGTAGNNPASGTRIAGFTFDGRGVGSNDLDPLALGVLARFADRVTVAHDRFLGTVQAVTNTGGDRWLIAENRIEGLTLFDCTAGLCAGGDGIVVQIATTDEPADPLNRPEGNVIFGNEISGTIPDGFDVFSMAGIFVLAADGTVVEHNRVAIPDNPSAGAEGDGILVSDTCCGDPVPVSPGARNTVIAFNDGRASEFAVAIEGTGGANTQGLVLFADLGRQIVEGTVVDGGRGRHRMGRAPALRRRFF